VRTRPHGWPFDFVPTGAYVPDPAAVLDSARWDRIAEELEATGELMLLLVPAATPGLGALSRRTRRAVLIGDEAGVERAAARLDDAGRVVAVVQPAATEVAALSEDPDDPEAHIGAFADLTEPVVVRGGRREGRRSVSPLLVIGLIVGA